MAHPAAGRFPGPCPARAANLPRTTRRRARPRHGRRADRLFGVYVRVRLLAQQRGLDLVAAGATAVREGLVKPENWELVRKAIGG